MGSPCRDASIASEDGPGTATPSPWSTTRTSRKYTRSGSRTARSIRISAANPFVGELRGALDYAAWGFLQRDAKVTHYAYYNTDRVEGRRIQLTNADKSLTFAAIHMHENRLYILEGTAPAGSPPPALFQQSSASSTRRGSGFAIRLSTQTCIRRLPACRTRLEPAGPGVEKGSYPFRKRASRKRVDPAPFCNELLELSSRRDARAFFLAVLRRGWEDQQCA